MGSLSFFLVRKENGYEKDRVKDSCSHDGSIYGINSMWRRPGVTKPGRRNRHCPVRVWSREYKRLCDHRSGDLRGAKREQETFFILNSEKAQDLNVLANLYSPLLEVDLKKGQLRPAVAKEWGTEGWRLDLDL